MNKNIQEELDIIKFYHTSGQCGSGEIVFKTGLKRKKLFGTKYGAKFIFIPDDLEIPTCSKCNSYWLDEKSILKIERNL